MTATRIPTAKPEPEKTQTDVSHKLAEVFGPEDVQFKPQVVKGNRALALAYIDARTVMDRLDAVVGVQNWRDDYTVLPDHAVQCRLSIRFGRVWITKVDVGSPSEQPDGGDRMKAAYSDALKRAAVKFGIGRYLYSLPIQWADFDPIKKQFTTTPQLPTWATKPRTAVPSLNGSAKSVPVDGPELERRLREADATNASKGLWPAGSLVAHVTQAGEKAGYGVDVSKWTGPAITLAVAEAKKFKTASLPF